MKRRFISLAAMAISASLALGTITPALADEGGSLSIGKVNSADQSYFELKQIHLASSQNSKLAVIQVSIHNGGSVALKVIDYWIRLTNKAGSQFPARLIHSGQDKTLVAPGSNVDLTYYADINEDTQLQDLSVEFIKWDLNMPKFERLLGAVAVPAGYSDVTPLAESSILRIGKTEVKASIKKLVSSKNEKYHVPTVYLTLENVGENTVTLPAYLFSIRAQGGLLFPLDAKGLKDTALKPKESKEFQLSGSIPIDVSPEQWELVIDQLNDELKMNLPIAAFQLPTAVQTPDGSIGKEYSFTTKSGVYIAQMNAMYRLPWQDKDLLSADISIGNKGPDTLVIPKLTGYFLLDDAVKIEANVVQTASAVGIASGSALKVQMVGKIPYTSKYSRVKLVLQENDSDTGITDLVEFTNQSEIQAIPFQTLNRSIALDDEGRKMALKVRNVNHYSSNTGSLVIAQVEAKNLEKRYTALPKTVAYFKATDETVIPAAVADVTSDISPNGSALLNISASLPRDFSPENMQIILGESVTEGKLTENGDKADSYVNPVALLLPAPSSQAQDSLMNVDAYPYQISIYHIGTMIADSTFTMKFNYEITRDGYMQTNVDGHKLVLVFEDGGGEKSFEKWFEMKDFDPVEGETPETGNTKLKLGKHENFQIQVNDAELIYKSSFLKQYKISLYDEFQGQRKLLAKQKADWFITTD